MDGNQMNSPVHKGRGKYSINPTFNGLDNPKIWIEHKERLINQGVNPFPVEAFPYHIQNVIKATHESLNFPVDYIGASLLYTASVAIGNTYKAQIMQGYEQNAVVYIAIIGKPGTNKTHPLRWAIKPLEKLDNKKFRDYQTAKREYDRITALTKKERESEGLIEPITKPFWEQHLVNDFTLEALASVSSHNKRGVGVYVDELANWFKNFNRYNKGSDQEFWLSVWSGSAVKVNRKTSDHYNIPLPYIPVIGTIQPGVLPQLAANRTENGFLDRLLYVYPDNLRKEYWGERELNPNVVKLWDDVVLRLLDLPLDCDEAGLPQPKILTFTPEAKELLFAWQRENTDDCNNHDNDVISGVLAKIEMYAVRFALIFQMLRYACYEDERDAITVESVQGALKLVDYFKRMAVKTYTYLNNESPLDRLPADKQTLYTTLPETFTTHEGLQIAKNCGVPERTFKRFINNKDLFIWMRQGQFRKLY